jgi:hypothetical protein
VTFTEIPCVSEFNSEMPLGVPLAPAGLEMVPAVVAIVNVVGATRIDTTLGNINLPEVVLTAYPSIEIVC